MGFSYKEAYRLPIWQRVWFIKRFSNEMEKANGASRAAHANDPQTRGLTGKHRSSPPAKLRRFT